MPTQLRMSDIIRRDPVTLPPAATVQQACEVMHEQQAEAVVVVDDAHQPLGIFTGRDLIRLLAEGRDPSHAQLRAVMTKDPAHLAPGDGVAEALRLMRDGGFRHVPVVEDGRLVGMVSQTDLGRFEADLPEVETRICERR